MLTSRIKGCRHGVVLEYSGLLAYRHSIDLGGVHDVAPSCIRRVAEVAVVNAYCFGSAQAFVAAAVHPRTSSPCRQRSATVRR